MYEYTPPKNNQKAQRLIPLFLVGGGVLILLPRILGLPYASLFQLAGAGLLTAAIFLATRYVAKSYVYRICPVEDGQADFEVVELMSGQRRRTVCRIALTDVEEIITLKSEDQAALRALRERIRKEGRKLYHYCPDLSPDSVTYLLIKEQLGGPVAISLCPDEILLTLLQNGMERG